MTRAAIDAHKQRLRESDAGMEVITPGGVGLAEAIAEHEAEKSFIGRPPLRQTAEPIEMQVYLWLGDNDPQVLSAVLDEFNYATVIAQIAMVFTTHVRRKLTKEVTRYGEP